MLMVVDIGNSHSRFALFGDSDDVLYYWRCGSQELRQQPSLWRDGLQQAGVNLSQVSVVGVCAVVADLRDNLVVDLEALAIPYYVIGEAGDYGIGFRVPPEPADSLGADRAMNVLGGKSFCLPPFLVADFGTATTLDVCTAQGDFGGGVILPGVELMAQSLAYATSALPSISLLVPPASILGDSTDAAIRAGLYFGYGDMINGLIARLCICEPSSQGLLPLIICGGASALHAPLLVRKFIAADKLTLLGILHYIRARR